MGIKHLLEWFLSMLTLLFSRRLVKRHTKRFVLDSGRGQVTELQTNLENQARVSERSPRFLTYVSQSIFFETSGNRSGAYTHDPDDSGGETKWGISKRAHPHLNIKTLTYNQAVEIYSLRYWNDHYDYIHSDMLSFKLFDMGILNGQTRAVKILQKAIRKNGLLVRRDGVFGPITLTATNNIRPEELYEKYIKLFDTRFRKLVIRVQKNRKYLRGWLRRLHWRWSGDK